MQKLVLTALAIALALPRNSEATQAPVPPKSVPAFAEELLGEDFPGAFLAKPQGSGAYPVIVLLGGSEGGDGSARAWAPRFLAQGYAVLGLPYYAPAYPGANASLPQLPANFIDLPVDRLADVKSVLCARRDVRCNRIGIYGVSKGAELALLAGSLVKGFAAIAAIVPTDVVWEGWGTGVPFGKRSSFSWRGAPLPFVPYIGMAEEFAKFASPETARTVRLRVPHEAGRHTFPARAVAARIRVEAIRAPLLVAGGDADDVWNSGAMAQAIAERRSAAKLQTTSLIFTDAGHDLSGDGNNAGGSSSPKDVAAQKIIWPATLAFFARHLKR